MRAECAIILLEYCASIRVLASYSFQRVILGVILGLNIASIEFMRAYHETVVLRSTSVLCSC